MLRTVFAASLGLLVVPAAAKAEFVLQWPVACTVGETCEIQHYVDHSTGGDAKDYRCGSVTYKGHNGTDIRIRSMVEERAGVDVLAAAPGKVLRTRDDMEDVSVRVIGHDAIRDRDCGNGLVIAHSDGYETQYCHMAKGSLVVKAGDMVTAGQPLGHVGLSGDTEFPHLHITVRHDGKMIDPFADGEADGACSGGTSLWRADLQPALAYKAGAVLNTGFADRQVAMDDIDSGVGTQPMKPGSPALVAFVRAITLRQGDVQRIVLTGPNGVLADHSEPPLASNKDQVFVELGRRRHADPWPTGIYKAAYSVMRDGTVVVEKTFSTSVQP